jgi:hypothetical protein
MQERLLFIFEKDTMDPCHPFACGTRELPVNPRYAVTGTGDLFAAQFGFDRLICQVTVE